MFLELWFLSKMIDWEWEISTKYVSELDYSEIYKINELKICNFNYCLQFG